MTDHETALSICDQVHWFRRHFDTEGLRMAFDGWQVRIDNDHLQIEHGVKYETGHRIWDFMLMPQVPA